MNYFEATQLWLYRDNWHRISSWLYVFRWKIVKRTKRRFRSLLNGLYPYKELLSWLNTIYCVTKDSACAKFSNSSTNFVYRLFQGIKKYRTILNTLLLIKSPMIAEYIDREKFSNICIYTKIKIKDCIYFHSLLLFLYSWFMHLFFELFIILLDICACVFGIMAFLFPYCISPTCK